MMDSISFDELMNSVICRIVPHTVLKDDAKITARIGSK